MIKLLKYLLLPFLLLSACTRHFIPTQTKASYYEIKQFKSDSIANLRISPYKSSLDKEMNTVIAYSDSALTKDGYECTLGNFLLQAVEHDINIKSDYKDKCVFIFNRGGLRNNLPFGEITKQNIFELMPFENEIVVLTIKGEKLMECIKAICTEGKLISFNLNFTIKDKSPIEIRVSGQDFDSSKNYYVVTSDYNANGGDNCTFFANPLKFENTNVKLRDALLMYCNYLTKNKAHITPFTNGRITISK